MSFSVLPSGSGHRRRTEWGRPAGQDQQLLQLLEELIAENRALRASNEKIRATNEKIIEVLNELTLSGLPDVPGDSLGQAPHRGLSGIRPAMRAIPTAGEALRNLTDRERSVLRLVCAGHDDKTIACALGIAHCTVRFHLRSLFRKLGVRSKPALISLAASD